MNNLKLVKNAAMSKDGPFIEVTHYQLMIASYNVKNGIMSIFSGLSPTSNKQIKYFMEFCEPKKFYNENENFKIFEKNLMSEPLEF